MNSSITLSALLGQLVGGGLSGAIAFWFLSTPVGDLVAGWFHRFTKWLGLSKSENKRYGSIVIGGTLSFAFYLLGMALDILPPPGPEVADWLNLIISLFGTSFLSSQTVHARTKTIKINNGSYKSSSKWTRE